MNENSKIEARSRKYEGLAPLTKEIHALTQNIFGQKGFVNVDLITNWSEIIGADLAQGVIPLKLTFPQNKHSQGTLHVRTASGAFALLFEHQKMRVIDRINTYFGYPAISQINQTQGAIKLKPTPPQEVEWPLGDDEVRDLLDKVNAIESDDLRAQVFEIGVAMIQKRKKA